MGRHQRTESTMAAMARNVMADTFATRRSDAICRKNASAPSRAENRRCEMDEEVELLGITKLAEKLGQCRVEDLKEGRMPDRVLAGARRGEPPTRSAVPRPTIAPEISRQIWYDAEVDAGNPRGDIFEDREDLVGSAIG